MQKRSRNGVTPPSPSPTQQTSGLPHDIERPCAISKRGRIVVASIVVVLAFALAVAAQTTSQTPQRDTLLDNIRALLNSGRYADAITALEEAIKAEPLRPELYQSLGLVYVNKWRLELRGADFEKQIPVIRAEIESLLKSKEPALRRAMALKTAVAGYSLLSDDVAQKGVEDSIVAEFPSSDAARGILLGRIMDEGDKGQQADLIEKFVARFPENADWTLLAMLFRARAADPAVSGDRLIEIGQAWMRSGGENIYQTTDACVALTVVLGERRLNMDRAQALADDCAKTVDALKTPPDAKSDGNADPKQAPGPENQMTLASLLQEWTHAARGFVLLRRGKVEDAKKEMDLANGPLQPIKTEVEKNGFILWQDLNWRELGVRPRVLWLAEMYEAGADYDRAAKYLLAGCYNADERARKYVAERLPMVYLKLGRSPEQAARDIAGARQRFAEMIKESRPGDAARKELLANRIGQPAPDFQLSTLDKRTVHLADLKGKVVVVNFWATWCGPCVKELPELQKSYEAYKNNQNVVFIAVSVDENRAQVRPFIERNGIKMAVAFDDGAAGRYRLEGVPATFIIDRGGIIQFRETGFGGSSEDYQDRMHWRIDELLKQDGK